MKMIVLAIFLTVFVIEIENRVMLYPYPTQQQHHGEPGCYIDTIKHFLSFNESFSPQDGRTCEKYTCDFDGYTYITSCEETIERDCVKVSGNKTLPYPSCCDYLDCSKRNKVLTPQNGTVPNPDKVTEKKNIEDLESKPTTEKVFTTLAPQNISDSPDDQSSLDEKLDNTDGNKSPSVPPQALSDDSKVNQEINNQLYESSENMEMSTTESETLTTPNNLRAEENESNDNRAEDEIETQNEEEEEEQKSKGIEEEGTTATEEKE